MGSEPKVTGLSPMTGPPGTKITVRGDNFGINSDDIISLTINGADCLPYLEWKSPKKIVTRCAKVFGSGDIVITTNSGGVGTCDVQFNCYEENVGPTDESAVWVSEIEYQTPEKEKLAIPGSSEEYSVDILSTKFKPQLYLLHNYSNISVNELEKVYKTLKVDLANKSDPEVISSSSNRTALLKSNLTVIMECLQILERLSKVIATSKDTSIESIVRTIKESLTQTHDVFDPLLAQKDLVQSIESAMQVFKQNETLFNLPSAIENSIKTKNYDSVVKEISAVISRLKTIDIDQSLTEKIQIDVATKVEQLKSTIESQLHVSCSSHNGERSIDDLKKLISHLNRLSGSSSYDVWIVMNKMSKSLLSTLAEQEKYHLRLTLAANTASTVDDSLKDRPPHAVNFVQTALSMFQNTFYDIILLGQSYFDPKDEYGCKKSDDERRARMAKFDDIMISRPINILCTLLRRALIPDSAKLDKPSDWPVDETKDFVNWLKHVLQSVISCNIQLTKTSLPPTANAALADFKELVFELRVRSMQILFSNATRTNRNLHTKEDWVVEVNDTLGGRTELPMIFEENVVETLRFANETIFKTNLTDKESKLERVNVQAYMKELAPSLINSFINSLENALIESREQPAESARILLAGKNSSQVPSKYMNRLLITICNCQYTKDVIFIRLRDEFERLPGLKTGSMDKVFEVCSKKYCDYINKISEKFCTIKCAELSKGLTEANLNNSSNRDLQINLMIVNSQIYLVAPQLVNKLMTSIVNSMQKKLKSSSSQKL